MGPAQQLQEGQGAGGVGRPAGMEEQLGLTAAGVSSAPAVTPQPKKKPGLRKWPPKPQPKPWSGLHNDIQL